MRAITPALNSDEAAVHQKTLGMLLKRVQELLRRPRSDFDGGAGKFRMIAVEPDLRSAEA